MKPLIALVIVVGVVVTALATAVWIGAVDVSASKPASAFEKKVATFIVDRSVERRAPRAENPLTASPAVLSEGLAHYRSNCLPCHGAPGVDAFDFGQGLNPSAPDLARGRTRARSDGELFWVVNNGIRLTGMPAFGPTHGTEELWSLVAFVRHLPELTSEERSLLREALESQEHHHKETAESAAEDGRIRPRGTPPHETPSGDRVSGGAESGL